MRAYVGGFSTETNTFSPIPCGLESFAPVPAFAPGSPLRDAVLSPLLARGVEIVGTFNAFAEPAGRITARAYATLRERLLDEIRAAGPVDAVFLFLHGAMAAEGCDDCEGDFLAAVREIVGPARIGVELDLHCHLTDAMIAACDVIVTYKEYPHTDVLERGREVCQLLLDVIDGRLSPVMSVYDCRMLELYFTTREPMRGFVDRVMALEATPDVASISIGYGFPWADVADVGTKVLVITNARPDVGRALAEQIGRELYALRGRVREPYLPVDEAIARAEAHAGCTVIADATDNPGTGAPGDATFILRGLLDAGVRDAALGALYDPGAVSLALQAGIGATLRLRIGGKTAVTSGEPLDITAEVIGASPDFHGAGPSGGSWSYGDVVAVRCDGVEVVLASRRTQTFARDVFAAAGVDLAHKHIVVVKSTNHFSADFAAIADQLIYADAPGTSRVSFAEIPYTKLRRPMWPLVADPFGR
jgi:microcystin degradation protein MlrC